VVNFLERLGMRGKRIGNKMRLKGKVAIVVGGANGIGRATSQVLAREGAKVMVADLDIEGADQLVSKLNASGMTAIALKVDMTNQDDADRMVKTALEKFGQIDILANVAGGSTGKFIREKLSPFSESSKKEWDLIIDINLTGPRNCTRAVINHMLDRRYGKIINFSSIFGMTGGKNAADYSAAKAGIIGFTKALALEVSGYGINVNCVSPGVVGTARVFAFNKESQEKMIQGAVIGRMATPEEIANVVLFLASDESSYITGENIPVVGGKDLGE
jgi:NAD(P)-dependent dehydrogenase (short-subunit alcohol dehydrogenase family)